MKDIKINDTVYAIETWTGAVFSAKVTKVYEHEYKGEKHMACDIQGLNWSDGSRFVGSTTRLFQDCFATLEDANRFVREKHDKLLESYKAEITDVEALINFACNHCIASGEEYMDWEAREAYILRAKELGFTIHA